MNCDYQIGKYYQGDVVVDESGVSVQEVPVGDYQGEYIVRTITMRFNNQFTQQDKLKI